MDGTTVTHVGIIGFNPGADWLVVKPALSRPPRRETRSQLAAAGPHC
jgi:hypothetical protein